MEAASGIVSKSQVYPWFIFGNTCDRRNIDGWDSYENVYFPTLTPVQLRLRYRLESEGKEHFRYTFALYI